MEERNCVFCNFSDDEPDIILEDEDFIVKRNIKPLVEGHSLVIPKKHFETFSDLPADLYSKFLEITKKAVDILLEETGAKGYNLVANNGEESGQEVFHLHLHILPRTGDDNFKLRI